MNSSLTELTATDSDFFSYEADLVLEDVRPEQSGNYSCGPSNTKPVSVRLHVIDGKINDRRREKLTLGLFSLDIHNSSVD